MMQLSEVFFLVIVFYLLYRFLFNFLLPVIKATRHVRQQFRNMQGGMDEQRNASPGAERHTSTKAPAEDYIDFEEIKGS
jgi:hypothetical protein